MTEATSNNVLCWQWQMEAKIMVHRSQDSDYLAY